MRAPAVLLVLVSLLPASDGFAQVTATEAMPAGWEMLSAEDFLAAAQPFVAETTLSGRAEVDLHAWTHFFRDQEFVASADLKTLLSMVDLFGIYRPSGVTLDDVELLHGGIEERLSRDESALSGLDLYELKGIVNSLKANVKTRSQIAPIFVQWMRVNDWRSLETRHLYNLFGFVNADSIDRRKFSARWTGSLTAPRSGEYTFRQARVYQGDDSQLKIWVNGELVLNSSDGKENPEAYESSPVHFTGGQSVTFRAELVHETEEIQYSVSAPMALITWRSEGGGDQIIPPDTFTPPEGVSHSESTGLQGEYFADAAFSDLRVSRIDPTLDMVWTWPPTAPAETDATREVFSVIVDRLLDDEHLNQIAEATDEVVALEFDRNLCRIAYRMSATERLELVSVLVRNPRVLERLSPEAVGRLYRALYMLPGNSHLELIGEWALAKEQPRCQPGWYPGWGEGSYQKLNTDFYWAIGEMMQGPYEESAIELCDAYLVRPNGECCLPIAYAAAFAGDERSMRLDLLQRIDSQLEEQSLTGDQRMTWLIARTFAKEVPSTSGRPQPLREIEDLEEAMQVAESQEYKFWALQELVSRYSSSGHESQAKALTEEHRARFSSPNQIQAMAEWDSLADRFVADRDSQRELAASESDKKYRERIEKSRQKALSSGDSSRAERLGQLIE